MNYNLNDLIQKNNNNLLYNVVQQLQTVIYDITSQKNTDIIINQIKNIIILMNKIIAENQKNTEQIRKDIKQLNDLITTQFKTKGKKKYKDGEYVGEFQNGLRDGKGTFYYYENNEYERKKYEGDWKNDKIEGKGKMIWKNGCIYEGEWSNNLKEGKGKAIFKDGSIYEGEWSNNLKEGKGILIFPGGEKYEGNFKNSKCDGKGVLYYESGDRYEGDFKNGKRHGSGIMYFSNGGKSMGDFWDGKAIGKHVFLQLDGSVTVEIAK